jgi:hypothetical protein
MLYALGFSFYWIDLGFQQMADNVTVFVFFFETGAKALPQSIN